MSQPEEDTGRRAVSGYQLLMAAVEKLSDQVDALRQALEAERAARASAELAHAVKIAQLETKIALYSAMGAVLGGGMVEWLTSQLHR